MNWRGVIGQSLHKVMHRLLWQKWFPLTRYVPPGWSAWYDVSRFSATRQLGVVLDVGANVGQTVIGMAHYFPTARIVSFEPHRASFEVLQRRCRAHRNIHVEQMALGDVDGSRLLHTYADSELNTFVADAPRGSSTGQVSVPVRTLDAYCADEGIETIDLLKLDVQGWELAVLRGARNLLGKNGITFVFAEVGFHREDRDIQQFAELHDHLAAAGFRLCGFYDPFRWGRHKEYLGFANALYAHPARLAARVHTATKTISSAGSTAAMASSRITAT